MCREAPTDPTYTSIKKPRSARTTSPGIGCLRKPLFSVIYLSEVRPPHPLDMKLMTPCGVALIKYLMVL